MCELTLMSVFFHLATNHRPSRMIRNSALITAAVLILAYTTYAEVVNHRPCPLSTSEDGTPVSSNCIIHEVRVDPCREASEEKPCGLRRGRNASISFDYTTHFSGNVTSRVYWASEIMDLPFLGMSADACLYTACPAVPDQRQVYTIELPMSKKFPARMYDLKWKLWNNEAQECCFMFTIKLLK